MTVPPGDAYDNFVTLFFDFRLAATRVCKIKQRNLNQKWMSTEILAAIKAKDLLWVQTKRSPNCTALRLRFKELRNKVNAMIRLAKRNNIRAKFTDARCDSRKTWSLINNLRGGDVNANRHVYVMSCFSSNGPATADDLKSVWCSETSSRYLHIAN